jgi:NhaA family Na+:H+ antiporter
MSHALLTRSHQTMRDFLRSEALGGLILIGCVVLALLLANSPYAATYHGVLTSEWLGWDVKHWVNDGLMAIFFLLVGLEIKRELVQGELSSWQTRILPLLAAVAGMAVPAALYLSFNWADPVSRGGWAIPAATDIAFALGVMSLLGSRVPVALKTMLTAIAIIDDLGAVVIIALFYSSGLAWPMLGAAAGVFALLMALNKFGCRMLWPYLLLGIALWFFTYQSGIHATIAGVLLATTIPLDRRASEHAAPLEQLEHKLHGVVAFVIVPLFALANAGLNLSGLSLESLGQPVTLGVALGLLLGKLLGVFGAIALAVKIGWARLPHGCTMRHSVGMAALCGIGFTMSLFIGLLAFPGQPQLVDAAKLGVLAGSLAAALLGGVLLITAPLMQKSKVG